MRILITAIGSMSAECAINRLREKGHYVVGCDIYPAEWHIESKLCDAFHRAPYATDEKEYVGFLLETCREHRLGHIIPLTDLEIDVLNRHRGCFGAAGIVLCMQSAEVLSIARDKYRLFQKFAEDGAVPTPRTCLLSEPDPAIPYPCIAKPYNGRSSEGLIRNATREQVQAIGDKEAYILQEQIAGPIITVDYCRSAAHGTDAAVPRQELLRTKNGAGLTVQVKDAPDIIRLASHIGNALGINGCVNMEFISNGGRYYLIDINPRFSAGVAFSVVSGYDMVNSHMNCFEGKPIAGQPAIQENIIIKKYQEVIY